MPRSKKKKAVRTPKTIQKQRSDESDRDEDDLSSDEDRGIEMETKSLGMYYMMYLIDL